MTYYQYDPCPSCCSGLGSGFCDFGNYRDDQFDPANYDVETVMWGDEIATYPHSHDVSQVADDGSPEVPCMLVKVTVDRRVNSGQDGIACFVLGKTWLREMPQGYFNYVQFQVEAKGYDSPVTAGTGYWRFAIKQGSKYYVQSQETAGQDGGYVWVSWNGTSNPFGVSIYSEEDFYEVVSGDGSTGGIDSSSHPDFSAESTDDIQIGFCVLNRVTSSTLRNYIGGMYVDSFCIQTSTKPVTIRGLDPDVGDILWSTSPIAYKGGAVIAPSDRNIWLEDDGYAYFLGDPDASATEHQILSRFKWSNRQIDPQYPGISQPGTGDKYGCYRVARDGTDYFGIANLLNSDPANTFFVIKFNKTSGVEWAVEVDEIGGFLEDSFTIIPSNDGGCFFGAVAYSNAVGVVRKINSSGEMDADFNSNVSVDCPANVIAHHSRGIVCTGLANAFGTSSWYNHRLWIIDSSGNYVDSVTGPFVNFGSQNRIDMCVDSSDNIIIASSSDGQDTIYSYAPDLTLNWSISTDVGYVWGLTTDSNGDVYVATNQFTYYGPRVDKRDGSDGSLLWTTSVDNGVVSNDNWYNAQVQAVGINLIDGVVVVSHTAAAP